MEPTDLKNGLLLLAVFAINIVLIGFYMRILRAIGKFIGLERLINWMITQFSNRIKARGD